MQKDGGETVIGDGRLVLGGYLRTYHHQASQRVETSQEMMS